MWTLSTPWYLSQNVFKKFVPPISPTRDYVTGLVLKLCREARVTRESLGIITGARAELYFDGSWSSVSFDKIEQLAAKGTDMLFIEKAGVPEILTGFADKYGIAMVNTRGHITEYGKALADAAKKSGARIVVIVDYDAAGIKIASEYPTSMHWIGINDATLRYFKITRESVEIQCETDQYKDYVLKLVKNGRHPYNAENDNAGLHDDRFKDIDLEFITTKNSDSEGGKSKRVEIDAVLALVGDERFFERILYELYKRHPKRDYNRAMESPTKESYFNNNNFDILPKPVRTLLTRIQDVADAATLEEEETIKTELEDIDGFIDVEVKKEEIEQRLAKALVEDKDMKVIIGECEELTSSDNHNLPEGPQVSRERENKKQEKRQAAEMIKQLPDITPKKGEHEDNDNDDNNRQQYNSSDRYIGAGVG